MEMSSGPVLVVDDDATNCAMLRHFLERHGLTVTEAADGNAALEWLGKQSFDLVLLDILMPGLSGLEVLRALRQNYSMTALPVIMATVKDDSAVVVEALRAGANDYLTKPFDFPVVLARVQTQLALKRSVEQITRLERSLAQRNTELEEANSRMKDDLDAAARVQEALLPTSLPCAPGVTFAWVFRPCAELAGDLLNVVAFGERSIALYVLDVVDHGVKSALLAVMVSRSLAQLHAAHGLEPSPGKAPSPLPPGEVAAHLNQSFPWDKRTEQFFTLLYGGLDLATREFRFVSAGHPGPLYLPCDGPAVFFKGSGLPIGLGGANYSEQSLSLQVGDRLYLYSDGVSEARNAQRQFFGEDRLQAVLEQGRTRPLQEGLDTVLRSVLEWCGQAPPHDDISLLAVEVTGPASH
jgi:sigma-B regulation protein RsbU (phosphoserine phosphatase)